MGEQRRRSKCEICNKVMEDEDLTICDACWNKYRKNTFGRKLCQN